MEVLRVRSWCQVRGASATCCGSPRLHLQVERRLFWLSFPLRKFVSLGFLSLVPSLVRLVTAPAPRRANPATNPRDAHRKPGHRARPRLNSSPRLSQARPRLPSPRPAPARAPDLRGRRRPNVSPDRCCGRATRARDVMCPGERSRRARRRRSSGRAQACCEGGRGWSIFSRGGRRRRRRVQIGRLWGNAQDKAKDALLARWRPAGLPVPCTEQASRLGGHWTVELSRSPGHLRSAKPALTLLPSTHPLASLAFNSLRWIENDILRVHRKGSAAYKNFHFNTAPGSHHNKRHQELQQAAVALEKRGSDLKARSKAAKRAPASSVPLTDYCASSAGAVSRTRELMFLRAQSLEDTTLFGSDRSELEPRLNLSVSGCFTHTAREPRIDGLEIGRAHV